MGWVVTLYVKVVRFKRWLTVQRSTKVYMLIFMARAIGAMCMHTDIKEVLCVLGNLMLPLQWSNGLSIDISDSVQVLLGLRNSPMTFSAGIILQYRSWGLSLAGLYCMDTGTTPSTSLSYEW